MAKKTNKNKNSNVNKGKSSNKEQSLKKNESVVQKQSNVKEVASQKVKKENKSVVKEVKNVDRPIMDLATNDELKKLGIVIVILLIIFFVFYGITALVTDGNDDYEYNFDDNTPVEIQYDEILVGGILNQNRDEYYVLLERSEDVTLELYHYYISMYTSTTGAFKVYTVDVDNPFNKDYIAEKSNLKVSDVSKIKISDTALLHVKENKVIASYEGKENIVSQLKKLVG